MLQPVFKKEQYRLKRSKYVLRTYKYGHGREAFEAKVSANCTIAIGFAMSQEACLSELMLLIAIF